MACDVTAAVADLGIDPLAITSGDVIEHGIVILKVSHPTDGSSMHRVLSSGLTHWEAIGLLTDALDGLRWAGVQAEDAG